MVAEFVTLDGFHRRRLQPGEPLSVYMHKLLDRATPGQERPARDQLLLHQFVTGLPDAISRQLRAAGETRELEKAVERVTALANYSRPRTDDCNYSNGEVGIQC